MPFYPAPVASSSVLSEVTYTFTTAELATANGTPISILAAQGAGTAVVPIAATFQYKAGAVAFSNATAELYVLGSGGFDFWMRADDAGGYTFNTTTSFFAAFRQVLLNQPLANFDNAGLTFATDVDPVDPGTGDGAGRITVVYYVMTLA